MTDNKIETNAIEKEKLIEIGNKISDLVAENKDMLKGVFCCLYTEDHRIVVAHGKIDEVVENLQESFSRLVVGGGVGGQFIRGHIKNRKGEVLVEAEKGGN